MNNHLKEYLSFTKKERTGIIVLLGLIFATIALPHFLPDPPPVQVDKAALEKLKLSLSQPAGLADPAKGKAHRLGYDDRVEENVEEQVVLFAFDPNTLPQEGWKKLGIRARTAQTIQRYLAKGGRFRRPGDLYKIYGLKKEEAERLAPYVRIVLPEATVKPRPAYPAPGDLPEWKYKNTGPGKPAIIDINTADTAAFIALRGIGSKLAGRIVHFREKLGGFHSVDQVGETYGLPDSTFREIREWLQCQLPVLQTININTANADLLQQHPYIGWPEANAIVQYRVQHGPYESVDQLLQINIITSVVLNKIRPYLAVK